MQFASPLLLPTGKKAISNAISVSDPVGTVWVHQGYSANILPMMFHRVSALPRAGGGAALLRAQGSSRASPGSPHPILTLLEIGSRSLGAFISWNGSYCSQG